MAPPPQNAPSAVSALAEFTSEHEPVTRRRFTVGLVASRLPLTVLASSAVLAMVVARSVTGPAVSAAPVVAQQSPAQTATLKPAAIESAPATPAPSPAASLSGAWRLTSRIESTDVAAFDGLVLGYEVHVAHTGSRVRGTGFKLTENGHLIGPPGRTPIDLDGTVENGRLELAFIEEGTRRTSRGTLALVVTEDGSLQGRFESDAARSAGTVEALRID